MRRPGLVMLAIPPARPCLRRLSPHARDHLQGLLPPLLDKLFDRRVSHFAVQAQVFALRDDHRAGNRLGRQVFNARDPKRRPFRK